MDNKASFRGVAQGCADEIAAVVTRLMEHSAVRLPHDGAGASAPLPDHEEVGKIIALGGRLIFPGFSESQACRPPICHTIPESLSKRCSILSGARFAAVSLSAKSRKQSVRQGRGPCP